MSEPEPLLWNVEQSHQDLHDVINRLAVKPADEVSKEDIQEANELRNHHVGISTGRICGQYTENAEATRTNSPKRPMTADERAAKHAFIDKMLGTWSSADEANKTVGIDDTWTVDGGHLTVEPHKTSDVHQGPNITDEWPEWPSPAQGAPDGVVGLGPLLFEDRSPKEQVFEDCETPSKDCHSSDASVVSDETLQDQRRHLHQESIEGESGILLRDEYRHRRQWSVARGRAYLTKTRGRVNLGKRPRLRSTDLVWDT